jgi:aromatic ring-opening dioxygenase catalytic subunit (LigB family)
MEEKASKILSPVLYLPHGGGPLPLLGDARHIEMVNFLESIGEELGKPSAILLISAHWEEDKATVISGECPELIYDYYGFSEESYKIQYPAPGDPKLAKRVCELLKTSGIEAELDEKRGFDHGMFIPLKLMYPKANIPCVQLSLLHNLNPAKHMELGRALSILRRENVLIIGSGMSFHNLREFFSSRSVTSNEKNEKFSDWLIETLVSDDISKDECETRLNRWNEAPNARFCHPREDHLLPLHVCYGVASEETPKAKVVFDSDVMGKRVVGFLWK